MKKFLIIIMASAVILQASAQKRWPESVKVISYYSASIILNAVGDGLNDNGNKTWGHTCNALSIGTLLVSPVVLNIDESDWGYYLLTYVTLRFSLFDYTYNATRGLDWDYVGNSSISDKILRGCKPPPEAVLFGRTCSFIVGISTPITKLDYKRVKCYLNKNHKFLM